MKLKLMAGWTGVLLGSSLLAMCSGDANYLRRALQVDRTYLEGEDRVAGVDRSGAVCIAGENGATGPVNWTEINYYYVIHASSAVDGMKEEDLESMMWMLIQMAILWCTLPPAIGVDISRNGGGRKLRELVGSEEFAELQRKHRKLTETDARSLSIIALNNNPEDDTIDDLFTMETSPCQFSKSPVCTVMLGRMGITAHASDNLDLVIASILDAIQEVMDEDMLIVPLCTEDPCVIEKIEYWGDNMAQVESNVDFILNNPDFVDPDDGEDGGDGIIIIPIPPGGDGSDGDGNGSGGGSGGDGTGGDGSGSGGGSGGDGTGGDGSGSGGGSGGDGTDGDGSGSGGGSGGDGTDGDGSGGDGSDGVDEINGEKKELEKDDDNKTVVLFAAVPIALLVLLLLLLARNRRKSHLLTPAELADLSEDYIIPGTGDPPRAFHEGMYHYTRAGARYLSTNCFECHETRKSGMLYSLSDLPTINELRSFDPNRETFSYSYDDNSSTATPEVDVSAHDPSAHRKHFLVEPSTANLGQKASTVDVHQCNSATCRICAYKPRDVAFLETPGASMSYLPAVYSTASTGLGISRSYDNSSDGEQANAQRANSPYQLENQQSI